MRVSSFTYILALTTSLAAASSVLTNSTVSNTQKTPAAVPNNTAAPPVSSKSYFSGLRSACSNQFSRLCDTLWNIIVLDHDQDFEPREYYSNEDVELSEFVAGILANQTVIDNSTVIANSTEISVQTRINLPISESSSDIKTEQVQISNKTSPANIDKVDTGKNAIEFAADNSAACQFGLSTAVVIVMVTFASILQ